jgi:uncharacterized membrane protein
MVGLLLLLAVSLSGNLFVGGVMLGRAAFQPDGPATGQMIRAFVETLPEDARPIVRRHMRERAEDLLRQIEKIRVARAKVADVLGRSPLDEAALAAAFREIRTQTAELQSLAQGILMDAISELPPEVRTEWSSRWEDGSFPVGN